MKNPRKSTDNPVVTLTRTLNGVQQDPDLADLPFVIDPGNPPIPEHQSSPDEESFRAFLHSRMPRQKASQALRERIKNAIKSMPD